MTTSAGPALHVARVLGVLEPGGAQLSVLRLARAQQGMGVRTTLLAGDATSDGVELARHHGFEPAVYAPGEGRAPALRQWCPDPEFAAWLAPRLAGCDLVHGHMFGGWWAAASAAPPGVPVVASEHNALSWPLGDHTHAAARAAGRLSAFFAHGPASAAFASSIGLHPDRIRTGRSPVDLMGRPRPDLASPRVTFTGRLRQDKGPDLLIRALALMAAPPAAYVIGDGPMRPALERMAADLGLARTVRMPGWTLEPGGYVAGAAVHVVPSRQEAWSQSALTALGLGVPVVATAVEGQPLMLADGRGVLVPPEDPAALAEAIAAVLAGEIQPDLEAGRRLAAQYDAGSVAATYLDTYRQAMSEATAGRPVSP